jgi:hypothetical protein
VSSGPFILNPNDTIEVAFAYIAGDSLADLQNSAAAAQVKYDNNPIIVKNNSINAPDFSLYPNPVKEMLTVSFSNMIQNPFVIRIIDLQGKLIQVHQFNYSNSSIQLPLANLENGIYFMEVITKEKVKTEKFVFSK